MRRSQVLTVLALAVVVFIGISVFVARGISGASSERENVLHVVRAQAAGNARVVLAHLPECARVPACVATTQARVQRLKRPGVVEILQYVPSVQLALIGQTGTGRVAWRVGSTRPVVQCVRVHRDGPFKGAGAQLIAIGPPIGLDGSCP